MQSRVALMPTLDEPIQRRERSGLAKARLRPEFKPLSSVTGIGRMPAPTVALEAGETARFARVGRFASFRRRVQGRRTTHGKPKVKSTQPVRCLWFRGPGTGRCRHTTQAPTTQCPGRVCNPGAGS